MKAILRQKIEEALREIGFPSLPSDGFSVEKPSISSHGDYSTNVAMVSDGNPVENSKKIVELLKKQTIENIENIEIAGPGFINFYLTDEYFSNQVKDILAKGEDFGKNDDHKGERVIFEYTDPNPFKEFHIGHLMPNTIGESLSRLYDFSGANVIRTNYQGDVGMNVAKAVWGMRELLSAGKEVKTAAELGVAYVLGSQAYDENSHTKDQITELNKKIYEKSDEQINELYKDGRQVSLDEFEKYYKILGTKFDKYYFESEVADDGAKIVRKHIGSVFEESDGAVIFPEEKSGLHTRVFINSKGLPTYEAKDLALVRVKSKDFPFDHSFVITGSEQNEYFKVVLKAMEFIDPELSKKSSHIGHGMLLLPEGKMSSRSGNVITAERLIGDIQKKVLEKMKDTDLDDKEKIAETIAVASLKYSILKQATEKDTVFDVDRATSFEGDSGPYIQYTYTRSRSILKKAKSERIREDVANAPKTGEVERILEYFPEIVRSAQKDMAPHIIATYLISLSSAFNSFYAKKKIVDPADKQSPYKVSLTRAVSIVLKSGLWLLGIEAPEKM